MKIKYTFGIKSGSLEKIYGSKNETLKGKIFEKIEKNILENEKNIYKKVLEEIFNGEKISNKKIETIILENIFKNSDLGEKFENYEFYFGKNIIIKGIFKDIKNGNNYFKIISKENLEKIKGELENFKKNFSELKNTVNGNIPSFLGDGIENQKIENFLKNINHCIENNLEMIVFLENYKTKSFLKKFIIYLGILIIFIYLFDFGKNFLLSENAKARLNFYFDDCENIYNQKIDKNSSYNKKEKTVEEKVLKDVADMIYKNQDCKKFEGYYNLETSKLDKFLLELN